MPHDPTKTYKEFDSARLLDLYLWYSSLNGKIALREKEEIRVEILRRMEG